MSKFHKDKNIIFGVFILLIFCIKFNFFLNIYLIFKNNLNSRLLLNYGYCYPMGYGFIKEIKKKYNLENKSINTINNKIFPTSNIFSFTFKSQDGSKEILINYDLESLNKIKRNYSIIEKQQNCYFIEYNND